MYEVDSIVCRSDQYDRVEDYYAEQMKRQLGFLGDGGVSAWLGPVDTLGDLIQKSAGPLLSTTTAAVQAVYAMGTFLQYVTAPNALGSLKKRPWEVLGYRPVIAASQTSGIGRAEGSTIAAGEYVIPDFAQIDPVPKEIRLATNFTFRFEFLQRAADTVKIDDNRQTVEKDFYRSLDKDLLQDLDGYATGNNVETLMKIVTGNAEVDGTTVTAGDVAIYGNDITTTAGQGRDATGWANANVLGSAATTIRDLTEALIDDLFGNQWPYWDPQNVDGKNYLTGVDTALAWARLAGVKQRFAQEMVTMTVGDGIRTLEGQRGGFKLSSWDGMPILIDDQVTKARSTLSQLLLLDQTGQRLGMAIARPVEYITTDNQFIGGARGLAAWYGMMETYATHFKSHGKLEAIK